MDPADVIFRFGSEGPSARSRKTFTLVTGDLPHRRYRHALTAIAELHLRRRTRGTGGGLLLTGPSGAGKSTVARAYSDLFPRSHEAQRTVIPVLPVSVPSSPTSRSLAGAILEALGQRKAHRGSAPEKTEAIRQLFEKCSVEMLLLDEFQHLFYPPTLNAFRDVTDWLKNLIEQTRVAIVGCGLPESGMVVDSNEQLARRFSARIRVSPFSLDAADDFLEFRGLLKAFEGRLPLPCETPLHEANQARRIHVASYGLLDYVVRILESAASAAADAGMEAIDGQALAAGFRNSVWRDVPERLNPFHPDSTLRALDRPGEVFHRHTHLDPVGSPVARKLGMNLTRGGR